MKSPEDDASGLVSVWILCGAYIDSLQLVHRLSGATCAREDCKCGEGCEEGGFLPKDVAELRDDDDYRYFLLMKVSSKQGNCHLPTKPNKYEDITQEPRSNPCNSLVIATKEVVTIGISRLARKSETVILCRPLLKLRVAQKSNLGGLTLPKPSKTAVQSSTVRRPCC